MKEEWLKGRLRNGQYSLRAFSKRLNVPTSAVSELFSGRRQMTRKMAERVLKGMVLEPLVRESIMGSLEPASRMESRRSARREFVQLETDHFHIISEWFYYAVLSLSETNGFIPKPLWIARRLGISESNSKLALERLTRLGLLKVNRDGSSTEHAGIQVTTTTDVPDTWLKCSHLENIRLAERSLSEDPVEERDFSSMTLVSSPARVEEAKRRIRRFRRELTRFME